VGKTTTRVAGPRDNQVAQTEITLAEIGKDKGRIMSGLYLYNNLI
jgi:hypothetical protein